MSTRCPIGHLSETSDSHGYQSTEAMTDIVDFAIELDDVAVHHVQVKATTKPDQYPLQPADARAALNRLLGRPADNSTLLIDVEKGRRSLLFERLYDLARALDVPITDILRSSEEPES
jgi:hypothetical protein